LKKRVMSKNTFTNAAGVKDPLSLKEFREAITSSQATKAMILAFNFIDELLERVAVLEDALQEKNDATEAKAESTPAKTTARKTAASKSAPEATSE
jgi:hypothetical protein